MKKIMAALLSVLMCFSTPFTYVYAEGENTPVQTEEPVQETAVPEETPSAEEEPVTTEEPAEETPAVTEDPGEEPEEKVPEEPASEENTGEPVPEDEPEEEIIAEEEEEDSSEVFATPISDFSYTVNDGEVTITKYNGTATEVSIPSSINGCKVTEIGEHAFYFKKSLISISIPNSITCIGFDAFFGCSQLIEVHIKSMESWLNIDFISEDSNPIRRVGPDRTGLYLNDEEVTQVIIPPTITEIKQYAFSHYGSLMSIIIPDTVSRIGQFAFMDCKNVDDIIIPGSVKDIEQDAFLNCTSLSNLSIQDGVTNIGIRAFSGCPITNVVFPNSVIYIGEEAFSGCGDLCSVTLPRGITSIKSKTFYECINLASVAIPEGITLIESSAFEKNTALKTIMIPESLTTIENNSFNKCDQLTDVYYSGDPGQWDAITVGLNNNALLNANIVFLKNYTGDYYYEVNGEEVTLKQYLGNNTNIEIPSEIDGYTVRHLGNTLFCGNSDITTIIIPDCVTSIGDSVFKGCTGLTSMMIPESVTSIGEQAFEGCTNLQNITIPASVTNIGDYAFGSCIKLKTIGPIGSDSNIQMVFGDTITIMYNDTNLFSTYLTAITIPDHIKIINDYAFYHCYSLRDVYYLGTQKQWDSIKIGSQNDVIKNSATIHVKKDPSDDYNYKISDEKVVISEYCGTDTEVEIPSVIEGYPVVGIGDNAFSGNSDIISLIIPEGVTSIGASAFQECSNLLDVTIPVSVVSIGDSAFYECGDLEDVHYSGTKAQWDAITIGENNDSLLDAFCIHVDSIAFTKAEVSALVDEQIQLEVIILPSDALNKDVIYTSSNDEVAAVDQNGVVTIISGGSATITATTVDGEKTATCKVKGYPFGIVVEELPDYIYTGSAFKPEVKVYDKGQLLTEKKDYTITYKNNVKAGEASVTIKSNKKGNYKGNQTVYFTIEPVDINNEELVSVDFLTAQATGKTLSPLPTLYYNGKKLKNKTDYTVSYESYGDRTTPGIHTVTVKGKGNFTGTRDIDVEVAPVERDSVSKLKITSKAIPYTDLTGDFMADFADRVTLKNSNTVLLRGIEYDVLEDSAKNCDSIGTCTFTVEGKGRYVGKRTVSVKITGVSLTDKKVKVTSPVYVYTGSEIELGEGFGVTHNGILLKKGEDYEIESYSNNLNAGKATAVLKGIKKYTGTRKVTFTITPDASVVDDERVTVPDAVYTKGGVTPPVTIEGMTEGTDFTVKYSNNKKVGTGTVKITFKGNYKNAPAKTRTFEITQKDLSEVTISAKDVEFSAKANKYKSKPVLTDTDLKALKAGTDYETAYEYTTVDGEALPSVVPAGTVVKVTVKGKGNYTGETSTTYRIMNPKTDISKATFKIRNKDFTGQAVELLPEDILTAKINKTTDLILGKDYKIESYSNNINKGTAKVTFRGINNYGGTKTVTFKIGQRSIVDNWSGVIEYFAALFSRN